MVKRTNYGDTLSDKGRMRIVFVELEGNNESLQEGLRTLVATMNRPTAGTPTPNRLASPTPQEAAAPQPLQDSLFDQEEHPRAPVEEADETDAGLTGNGSARKRGEGKKQDRNAGLAMVSDLNLRPTGKQNLKEFTNAKQPNTDEECVLVFVYYLKFILETDMVGPNHVFHCFKEASVRVPGDLKQTIRNIEKKAWLSFTDLEDIRVAVNGQNIVEHDLPRASSAKAAAAK